MSNNNQYNDINNQYFDKLISNTDQLIADFEAEIRAKELGEKASKPSSTKSQRTRITKELRKEVLRMTANGVTHKEISVLTGLCFTSISKIRSMGK